MEQLTMQDIYNRAIELKQKGIDLSTLPIYLGNDDELNGIHNGWYCEEIINNDDEDMKYIIDMINESSGTTNLKIKGILIS